MKSFPAILLFLYCMLLLRPACIHAQDKSKEIREEMTWIREEVKTGNKEAFQKLLKLTGDHSTVTENLGYHILQSEVSTIAWRTIGEYLVIDGLEFTKKLENKTAFCKELEKALPTMSFDPLLQAFAWKPYKNMAYPYRLQEFLPPDKTTDSLVLEELTTELKNVPANDGEECEDVLIKIIELRSPVTEAFFKQGLEPGMQQKYPCAASNKWNNACCYGISTFPTLENARLLIDKAKKGMITQDQAIFFLEKISGIALSERIMDTLNPLPVAEKYFEFFSSTEDMYLYAFSLLGQSKPEEYSSKALYYFNMAIEAEAAENGDAYKNALISLAGSKNPESLKLLAALVYRNRNKWNEYHFGDKNKESPQEIIERITQLRLLTGTDKDNLDGSIDSPYEQLRYFIYWNNHYKDYIWSEPDHHFINTKEKAEVADAGTKAYKLLCSPSSTVAHQAFLQLLELPQETVKTLINTDRETVEKADGMHFIVLPMFLPKRLMQLSILTNYCRKENITYKPSASLQAQLDSLVTVRNSAERYKLENRIIATASLNDITPIEFWCSSGDEPATYSIGRIVDKLYSRYFMDIVSSDQQLRLFLKKSSVYDQFGIIGDCNKLLWKFQHCDPSVVKKLKSMQSTETDPDIKNAVTRYFKGDHWKSQNTGETPVLFEHIIDIEKELARIGKMAPAEQGEAYFDFMFKDYVADQIAEGNVKQELLVPVIKALDKFAADKKEDSFDSEYAQYFSLWLQIRERPIREQLAFVSAVPGKEVRNPLCEQVVLGGRYSDIPVLLDVAETDTIIDTWDIMRHISEDLCIPINIDDKTERDTLRNRYKRLSEKELYKAYAKDFGLEGMFLPNNELDYDLIYDVLEYDVADGFVGGGGGHHSSTAQLVIRILEMQHNTLLGFHWRKEYISPGTVFTLYERSGAWMRYIREHKLLKKPLNPVPSFSN